MDEDELTSRLLSAAYSYENGGAVVRATHTPTGITATTNVRRGERPAATRRRVLGILRGRVATA